MNTIPNIQIKCAMIIYELEKSLAKKIKNRNFDLALTGPGNDILERQAKSDFFDSKIEQSEFILQSSYLNEIFSLCEIVFKDTSEEVHVRKFIEICKILDIFEIRNSISHPNREFPDCYWYRCGAIANDPLIKILTIDNIRFEFEKALKGDLNTPPEEWMSQSSAVFAIPTLLPRVFEHSITGLIGRRKDAEILTKSLKDQRTFLISIIAPGGIGKTSLTLQVLSDFCMSYEAPEYVDAVVFISLKLEKLTKTGIEILDAPQSINELKIALKDYFNELFDDENHDFTNVVANYKDQRIWLFIDNLETILRDNPQEFLDFYEDLPSNWKVIVTSRITVDSAKNIPLRTLDTGGAMQLAKSYLNSRGAFDFEHQTWQPIVESCNSNPLAIRLVIDRFLAGQDIENCVQNANTDLLNFSFSNLLDVLSNHANYVLESLFVIGDATRTMLCEILELDIDDISTATSELAKTSLIIRKTSENPEKYSLSEPIRDLLRARPKNIEIRDWVTKKIAQKKSLVHDAMEEQKKNNTSILDIFYIPDNTPASSIEISKKIRRAVKVKPANLEVLSKLDHEIGTLIFSQNNSKFLHRIRGKLRYEQKDTNGAIESLKLALRIDENDIPSMNLMNSIYLKISSPDEAEKISKKLINVEWKNKKDASQVWSKHLSALNRQGKIDEVFALTEGWKEKEDLAATFGAARAQAYRRRAEIACKQDKNEEKMWKLYSHALKTLDHIFSKTDGDYSAIQERKKLVNDIAFCLENIGKENINDEYSKDIASFISKYSQEIREDNSQNIQKIAAHITLLRSTDITEDIFQNLSENIDSLKNDGFVIAKIHNIPRHYIFPNYLFASDEGDMRYYMKLESFEKGNRRLWTSLKKGSTIAIKFIPGKDDNSKIVTEAKFIKI